MAVLQMAREKRSCPRASETQQNNSEKKEKVDGESAARDKRAITVTVDPEVLECDVCFGPLTPPLYQVNKHILILLLADHDSIYKFVY